MSSPAISIQNAPPVRPRFIPPVQCQLDQAQSQLLFTIAIETPIHEIVNEQHPAMK